MDQNRMREQIRNIQMLKYLQQRYGSQKPAQGAKGLEEKFDHGILAGFSPGNIGDINQALWPFYFTFSAQDVNPGQTVIESFSVTQEAGFLWRLMNKVVFLKSGSDYTFIDPLMADVSLSQAPGLSFTMRDAQSTREFQGREQQSVDSVGGANFPTLNGSTVFLLPNQTMQLVLTNSHPSNVYKCFMTFFGYRIRIENAQKILSLVKG